MNRPTLNSEEVQQAVAGLTTADLNRLERAGRGYALGLNCEGADLANDAVRLALEGRRRCPCDVNFMTFLVGVMKSRASALRVKADASLVSTTLDATGTDGRPLLEPQATARTIEEWRLAKEDYLARLSILEELFADDELALLFMWADLDETPKEEIKNMNNLDDSAYATVRRRMRRAINRRFPSGWTS